MTDTTIGMVYSGCGIAWMVLFWGFLYRVVGRRVRVVLEGLSQIMLIVVGGLVAATDVLVVKTVESLSPHGVLTWFLEYPSESVLLMVVWVILSSKGRPLREARERVPVLAFIGPSGGGGSHDRQQRWRDKFNEALEGNGVLRVLARGVAIAAAAATVLAIRGMPHMVPALAWVLFFTLLVAVSTWLTALGGRSPFDDP